MDGNVNRSRIALICALALGGICLWQLNASVSAFFTEKAAGFRGVVRGVRAIKRIQVWHSSLSRSDLKVEAQVTWADFSIVGLVSGNVIG